MTRRFLRAICRALVGVLLFAQLAVSAYACPALSSAAMSAMPMPSTAARDGDSSDAAMAAADQQAPDCDGMAAGTMDPDLANLCAEHCHHGQQSDQAATLSVPAALLTALYLAPLAAQPKIRPRPAADATSALVAASPPHAILHCCFRI
jgi:hypothetical protein